MRHKASIKEPTVPSIRVKFCSKCKFKQKANEEFWERKIIACSCYRPIK